MAAFTYTPDFGASASKEPRVRRAAFGDGYEQRQVFGLNTQPEVWSLRFANRDKTEADAIMAFLAARGGAESFDWTPPDEAESRRFVCRSWSRSIDRFNLYTVTATFEEVFAP